MKNKKSCSNCKYYLVGNHWPCVDCDMFIHDRWEKQKNNTPKIKEGEVEMENNIDDAYKRGAEDAWNAAKKIVVLPERLGGCSADKLQEILGTYLYDEIFNGMDCLEVIEKIQRYEEHNDLQVGDEIKRYGNCAVVVRTNVGGDESKMYVVYRDGSSGEKDKDGWTKTGRHFPQIAEVLKMMNEED